VNALSQKKQWKQPQLTVLVRIDLAESVLLGCKGSGSQTGALQNNGRCLTTVTWQGSCNACNAISPT